VKQIVFDAQTKETTAIEVPDIEILTVEQVPDIKEQAIAEINAATTLAGVKAAFIKFIEAS
jgi:hypothetical protein